MDFLEWDKLSDARNLSLRLSTACYTAVKLDMQAEQDEFLPYS